MALRDLLYRCPGCGDFPVDGRGDRVRCSGCGAEYLRGGAPARLRIRTPDGAERQVPTRAVLETMRKKGGPSREPAGPGGVVEERAEVVARRSVGEESCWYRGRLIGFIESLGPGTRSIVRLKDEGLEVRGSGGMHWRWNLMDLRAIQASSSTLQVYTAAEELVHLRFVEDSPLRWESLLQKALERAYRERGRGRILEFQPRIVTQ